MAFEIYNTQTGQSLEQTFPSIDSIKSFALEQYGTVDSIPDAFGYREITDVAQPVPDFATLPDESESGVEFTKTVLPTSMRKAQAGEEPSRFSIASDLITSPLRILTGAAVAPLVGAAGAYSAPWGGKTEMLLRGMKEGFQQGADQNPDAGFVESAWKDPMTSMFLGAGPALRLAGEAGGQLLTKLPRVVGKGVDAVKNAIQASPDMREVNALKNALKNAISSGRGINKTLESTGNILGVGTAGTGVSLASRGLTDESGISGEEAAIDAALNYGTAGLASVVSKLGEKAVTSYLVKRYGTEPDKLAVLLGEVDKAIYAQKDLPGQVLAPTKAGTIRNAAIVAQDPIPTNKLVRDIYQISGMGGNPAPVVNETPLNPSSWYAGKTIEEPAKVIGLTTEVPWVQKSPRANIPESLMSPDWRTPLLREVDNLNFRFTNGEILEPEYKKSIEAIRSASNQLRDMGGEDDGASIRPYMNVINKLSESNPELADVLLSRVIDNATNVGIDVTPYLSKLENRNELLRLSQLRSPSNGIISNLVSPVADVGAYLANPMARGGIGRREKLTPYIMGASDQLMGLDTLKSSK